MRNLIMWNLVTLDGYFEGAKSWDLDWHNYAWGEELERFSLEQLKTIDALLFGRVTYEGMASYWTTAKGEVADAADAMNSIPKIVFSKTLVKVDWNNTRLVTEDAPAYIRQLKREPGRDLFVFGSAGLSAALLREGLFDELRLCLVPVVLGGGNPLFKPGTAKTPMKLIEARPLKTGGVILRYQPVLKTQL
jgi:dihydrofolate reductase